MTASNTKIQEVLATKSKVVYRNIFNHWEARTTLELDDVHVLTILTMKRHYGSVLTNASVSKNEHGMLVHMLHQDFSQELELANPPRLTEKVVREIHNEINLESVIQTALCFYNINQIVSVL